MVNGHMPSHGWSDEVQEGERKCGTKDCSLAREHFRHLPDTRCTGRLSSPSVKSRSRLTQEISPASGLLTR